MGLIRRTDLQAVGGSDEWCVTEDAELSLRLLKRGGSGQDVDRFGRPSVMPLTSEALERQRFHWCFTAVSPPGLAGRFSPATGRPATGSRPRSAGPTCRGSWVGDLAALAVTGFLRSPCHCCR